MIELNLSPSKKSGGIANVAGIDLSHINVKMMVVALLIWFVPEPILTDMWDGQKEAFNEHFKRLNNEFRKLQSEVRKMQNVQKQVDALKEQEEKLARKLETVKKIINKRQNPYQVLKYIAENIPADVWVEKIELEERSLIIRGYAKKYQDIGSFITSLKNSIFFQNIDYQKPTDGDDAYKEMRLERFQITTNVVRFK